MSSIIPKEHLVAYQRWQANAFDAPPVEESQPITPMATAEETEAAQTSEPVSIALPLPTAEDIEQIHEQARNDGFQAGFEEGRQAGEQAMQAERAQGIALLAALTANFHNALASFDQVVAEQALDLALEVASLVIGSTVQTRRELLLPVIREALQALPMHHGNLILHVNPTDIESLREGVAEMSAQGNMHLLSDSTVSPGGCVLKAGHSEIDATLETRWKRVLEAIGVNPEQWQIR